MTARAHLGSNGIINGVPAKKLTSVTSCRQAMIDRFAFSTSSSPFALAIYATLSGRYTAELRSLAMYSSIAAFARGSSRSKGKWNTLLAMGRLSVPSECSRSIRRLSSSDCEIVRASNWTLYAGRQQALQQGEAYSHLVAVMTATISLYSFSLSTRYWM